MSFRDDLAERKVEVVLRFPSENGRIVTTDRETLKTEKRFWSFERDAAGRLACFTWVVPLGQSKYRLEDMWYGHPWRRNDEEAPGGLAFRDVFVAEHLADGSLLFDRLEQKAGWRIDCWMLPPPSVWSRYLAGAVAEIEAHGGGAEQDPCIRNWLWTFLPPQTDYDPTKDMAEALQKIPQAEIERALKEKEPRRSEEESS